MHGMPAHHCSSRKDIQTLPHRVEAQPSGSHASLASDHLSHGRPFDIGDRSFMEERFGHDVSRAHDRASDTVLVGHSLGTGIGAVMGQKLGHDFSKVSVHTDERAGEAAGAAQATVLQSDGQGNMESGLEKLWKTTFTCPPVAHSDPSVLSLASGGNLGTTRIDRSSELVCKPSFAVDPKAGTCTLQARKVSLNVTSRYESEKKATLTSEKMALPECGEKQVPMFVVIDKDTSASARVGEQEHCGDLSRAFNLTIKPCNESLNSLAGQTFAGKNETECYRSLVARLGFDPLGCTQEFITLAGKTEERDAKDWHALDPALISKDCTRIVVGFKRSKTNRIGDPAVAPDKSISAAAKCARPSKASPGGSTSTLPPSPKAVGPGEAED